MKKKRIQIPLVGKILKRIYVKLYMLIKPGPEFPGSERYWIERYKTGGNSGAGSYGRHAEFKAEIINEFIRSKAIRSVIEYGCGDGNQLRYAEYPKYIGFDISSDAINICRNMFKNDETKIFKLMSKYEGETAELTLSLEVLFHLIEDNIYESYMERLFSSSERFVIILSSNFESTQKYHEKDREFTKWVDENLPCWKLIKHVPNKYPVDGDPHGSKSDFYIYNKIQPEN